MGEFYDKVSAIIKEARQICERADNRFFQMQVGDKLREAETYLGNADGIKTISEDYAAALGLLRKETQILNCEGREKFLAVYECSKE